MENTKTYDVPSEAIAKNRDVHVDGPDGVSVNFTPEAAIATSHRLVDAAAEAAGQRLFEQYRVDHLDD